VQGGNTLLVARYKVGKTRLGANLTRALADDDLFLGQFEALGLNVGDVVFGLKPTLRIRRQFYRGLLAQLKTHNGRRDLPLSAQSSQALWRLCAGLPDDAPFFATRTGSRYLDGNLRRDALMPAAKAAGAPWAGFHTLRHTCASLLFEQGRNIAQVSKWLGHADPAFTLRTYIHLVDEGVGGALTVEAAAPVDTLTPCFPKKSGSASSRTRSLRVNA